MERKVLTPNEEGFEHLRTRPRILDFISIGGLERLTGCKPDEFVTFIVKEMVDNALDKTETTCIEVEIQQSNDTLLVSVQDDGLPQFSREMINKVLDFESAPSSKRGIKALTRGILGNALQCCIGISFALWEQNQPENTVEILGSSRFTVSLNSDGTGITHSVREEKRKNDEHTKIIFKLPIHKFLSPFDLVWAISVLNRNISISYEENGINGLFLSDSSLNAFLSSARLWRHTLVRLERFPIIVPRNAHDGY